MHRDKVRSQIQGNKEGEEGTRRGKSNRLDLEYVELRDQIVGSPFYNGLQKIMKIRIKGWIQAMDAIIVNPVWKKNRNNFAKLLDLMCECEVIVDPFSQAAPKNGLPNISKHEINAVIDHVELTVKANNAKQPKEQIEREMSETPKQHWSKIRMQKDLNRSSLEESSAFLGRFMDIIQKSNDASQIINGKFIQQKESEVLTADKENHRHLDVQTMKKTTQNQMMFCKTETKQVSRPKIKIREEKTPPSYFPKNARIKTDITDTQPLMFRDHHQSIEITNETLNTNELDQEDIDRNISEIIHNNNYTNRSQYNFLEGLTERHSPKDHLVRVQQRFNKSKMPLSDKKLSVRQISLVSSKPLQVQKSMLDLNISQSEHLSNHDSTHIHLQSIIDANSIAESQQRKMERKLYWESNSLSYDFQYREDQHISIDDEDEIGEIGEEGSANILAEIKISNPN